MAYFPDVKWAQPWDESPQMQQVVEMFQTAHKRQQDLKIRNEQEAYERQQQEIENARKQKELEFNEQTSKLQAQRAKIDMQEHQIKLRAEQEAEALKQGQDAFDSNQAGQDDYFQQGPTAANQQVMNPSPITQAAVPSLEEGAAPVLPERQLAPIELARQRMESLKAQAGRERVEKKADAVAQYEATEPFKIADDERTAAREAERLASQERRAAQLVEAAERRAERVAGVAGQRALEKAAGKLRVEYNQSSKKPRERVRAIRRGLSMGNPANPTPTSDYSLVYAFAKASDPESTVREGEFAGAKTNIGGWDQRSQQMWRDVVDGRMTPSKRADMIATIENGLKYEESVLADIDNHYRELADIEEINPERIFGVTQQEAPRGSGSTINYDAQGNRIP